MASLLLVNGPKLNVPAIRESGADSRAASADIVRTLPGHAPQSGYHPAFASENFRRMRDLSDGPSGRLFGPGTHAYEPTLHAATRHLS
jgi:3-dehydroquinate dehydratase